MESEVFVFTAAGSAARRHREATIEQAVPVAAMEPLAARIATRLAAEGHEEVHCWGSVPGSGNLRSWGRMQPGHWALLYGGEDRFPWLLRVALTGRSKRLARDLWGEDRDGRTWELMFFFDLARRVDLGTEEVREALAYEDGWVPQGLQYPGPQHQTALLEKFGSLEAFAASGVGPVSEEAVLLSPEELLMGGRFHGPPAKPPRAPQNRQPPDPDRSGRGLIAHEETVAKLRRHVGPTFRKGTPGINHDGCWKVGAGFCISEVKSITARNEVGQLQKGLGQILHNRFKARENGIEGVKAYLIAEREPANSALWVKLAHEHGVVFSWPERFAEDVEKPEG